MKRTRAWAWLVQSLLHFCKQLASLVPGLAEVSFAAIWDYWILPTYAFPLYYVLSRGIYQL